MHRYYFVFEITVLSKHIALLCCIIDIMISLLGAVTWALIGVVILGNKRTKSLCLFPCYFVLDFYFLELHSKKTSHIFIISLSCQLCVCRHPLFLFCIFASSFPWSWRWSLIYTIVAPSCWATMTWDDKSRDDKKTNKHFSYLFA